MTCRDVEARITAYLEGELDATTSSALRGHLRGCEACRTLAEDHARIAGVLAELPPAEPPAALWDGVMQRVAEAEAADARRSRLAILGARIWERLRPQLVPALALGAAATVAAAWLATRRGDERMARPVPMPVPAPEVTPVASPPPGDDVDADVEVALARELEQVDRLYAVNVDELLAIAGEERATWPVARQRAYDAELARLRSAVTAVPLAVAPAAGADPFEAAEAAAAAREARERAWQRLVRFLQRAALGELIARSPDGSRNPEVTP